MQKLWFKSFAGTLVLVAATVVSSPVEAGWLKRGLGTAGNLYQSVGEAADKGKSLHKNLGEATDTLGELLSAAIEGNAEEVDRFVQEFKELPFNIVRDAFPVLSGMAKAVEFGEKVRKKTRAAVDRISEITAPAVVGGSYAALTADPRHKGTLRRAGITTGSTGSGTVGPTNINNPGAVSTVKHWDIVAYRLSCLKTTHHISSDSTEYHEHRAAAERRLALYGTVVCEEDEDSLADAQEQVVVEDSREKDEAVVGAAESEAANSSNASTDPSPKQLVPRQLAADVQRDLAALGFDPGPADGIWGSRSRRAYNRFLDESGASNLPRDIPDMHTAENIRKRVEASNTSKTQETLAAERAQEPQQNSATRQGSYNCKGENERVTRAIEEATKRGTRERDLAHCAAVNIGRALIWHVQQCLERDGSLTREERRIARLQIDATRETNRQNLAGHRQLHGGREPCDCWSEICAN